MVSHVCLITEKNIAQHVQHTPRHSQLFIQQVLELYNTIHNALEHVRTEQTVTAARRPLTYKAPTKAWN